MSSSPAAVANANSEPARKDIDSASVFVSDNESEDIIRQSLNIIGLDGARFISGNVATAISTFEKQRSPKLLVVDVSRVPDPVEHMRNLAEVCEPDVNVVVIGDRNDIVLYRDLMSIGIADYFLKPLVRDPLTRAFDNIMSPQRSKIHRRTGKLVFMIGVRGGVGATTIATNTAWHLAETRYRHALLLDFNVMSGDAALQFDAEPSDALRTAVAHPDRVDKLFLDRAAKRMTDRLYLMASLEALDAPLPLTDAAVLPLVEKLRARYRFVVVDMNAVTASRMPKLLDLPSTRILISNSSLAAARDVARWREKLGPDTTEAATWHVLNRTAGHGGLSDTDFANACGQAADIVIPYDREIAAASVYGIKAMQKCSVFKRGLDVMLHNLTGEKAEDSKSVLHRIFG